MGIILVTILLYLLLAFWVASIFKARFVHKQPWGICLLIAFEAPMEFLDMIYWTFKYVMVVWLKQKKDIEESEEKMLDSRECSLLMEYVLENIPHSIPYLHSKTIACMIKIRQNNKYRRIKDFFVDN